MNGCSLCNSKSQMRVGPGILLWRDAWMGSYLWSCLPHCTSPQDRQDRGVANQPLPSWSSQKITDPLRTAASKPLAGSHTGNEGAQSCSGVSALALWQAQPGWVCKAVQDLKPWLRTVMLSRHFKWNQGLVSRRTTVSPPYNHPDVTKKHSLHFQKENFRILVSFIMSWLKSWYSSWNTGKHN